MIYSRAPNARKEVERVAQLVAREIPTKHNNHESAQRYGFTWLRRKFSAPPIGKEKEKAIWVDSDSLMLESPLVGHEVINPGMLLFSPKTLSTLRGRHFHCLRALFQAGPSHTAYPQIPMIGPSAAGALVGKEDEVRFYVHPAERIY